MKPQDATCVIIGSACSVVAAVGLYAFTPAEPLCCAVVGLVGMLGVTLVALAPDHIRKRRNN